LRYQSGFGNEFASEAVEGVLPRGQNSPQKVAHGLYAEQLSGTAFTAPRGVNRRTWLYRMRPSVAHKPFQPIEQGRLRSAPFDEVPTPPNQLRWMPIPIPASSQRTDFIDGLITMAGNGNTHTHAGVAIHIYVANASMTDRFFYNADGEMLIVPQQGRLLLRTEMGILEAAPGEIAVIQRGIRFASNCSTKRRAATSARTTARCFVCPIWGRLARTDWRIRATFWRRWRL
jgi:homogentisate 1,2-dioxygenase